MLCYQLQSISALPDTALDEKKHHFSQAYVVFSNKTSYLCIGYSTTNLFTTPFSTSMPPVRRAAHSLSACAFNLPAGYAGLLEASHIYGLLDTIARTIACLTLQNPRSQASTSKVASLHAKLISKTTD